MLQVMNHLVIDRFPDVDPKPTLSLVPQASLAEFWLPLTAFHLGESAKNGCLGLNCFKIHRTNCQSTVDVFDAMSKSIYLSILPLQIGRRMNNAVSIMVTSWKAILRVGSRSKHVSHMLIHPDR